MKRIYGLLAFILAFCLAMNLLQPLPLLAQTSPSSSADAHLYGATDQVDISDTGQVSISGAQIDQVVDGTFFAKVYWGQTYLRVTIRTLPTTQLTKRYGGMMSVSDVSVGDFVSVQGNLYSDSSVFDMVATTLKDWSVQTENDQFTGTVFAPSQSGFTLVQSASSSPTAQTSIVVSLGTSTVITKGNLTLTPSQISAGDTVVSAQGVFNYLTNTLAAQSVKIYQDMTIFQPRNFQGKIVSLSNGTLPAQITFSDDEGGPTTAATKIYKVNIPVGTSVLSANRSAVSIGRFLVGDTVRIYGSIQESDQTVINAQIIRNLDL